MGSESFIDWIFYQ